VEAADQERRTVLLAISGDTAAFGALVRRHQAWVRSLLRRSCGDAALAEDLAQATFLQAWRQLASLRDPDAFRAWLRRIAINRLVDAVRRRTIVTESSPMTRRMSKALRPMSTSSRASISITRSAGSGWRSARASCSLMAKA